MIYEFPPEHAPIRQGDIFTGVPRMEISLRRIPIVTDGEAVEEMPWVEAARSGAPVTAIVAAKPVAAIVVTQDCDALRAPDITLCEIREFRDVERKCSETTRPSSWMRIITQQARINQKWFYLPPDPKIGFRTKMAADFMVAICLARPDLEELRHLRAGRLNEYAEAHFRQRIGQFFRRYPYDEWYALDEAELEAYKRDHPGAEAYPWQAGSASQGH